MYFFFSSVLNELCSFEKKSLDLSDVVPLTLCGYWKIMSLQWIDGD